MHTQGKSHIASLWAILHRANEKERAIVSEQEIERDREQVSERGRGRGHRKVGYLPDARRWGLREYVRVLIDVGVDVNEVRRLRS